MNGGIIGLNRSLKYECTASDWLKSTAIGGVAGAITGGAAGGIMVGVAGAGVAMSSLTIAGQVAITTSISAIGGLSNSLGTI